MLRQEYTRFRFNNYGGFRRTLPPYAREQCHAQEILEYVRKVQGKDYLSNDYAREIAFNVIGDIIADNLSPEVVENVKSQFGMK